MSKAQRRLRFPSLGNVFFFVLIGANLVAAICLSLLHPLIYPQADLEHIVRTMKGSGAISLLAFVIPSVLCIAYIRPLTQAGWDEQNVRDVLARRRLLNAPLVLSLLSISGWLFEIVVFFFGAYRNDVPLRWSATTRYIAEMLLTGSLVFVIAYYLSEFISRKYYIPRFFPGGQLSAVSGVINLSVRARFFIYFFAATIFPIFLFYSAIAATADRADPGAIVSPAGVLAGLVLIVGAFLTYLVSNVYQAPLLEMKDATARIKAGDYEVRVGVVSNDEVGRLGEAVNEMAVGLKERELIKAAHQKVAQELAVAWRIQESFLPGNPPRLPGWQLTATLEPAKQTSGDFYDFIPLPDGRLGLLVADVTDKGVGAALYMALSRTLLRTYAVEHETRPELAFRAAHQRILADTDTSQFVTVFYGILDPATGTLTYSNAGHNPPYLVSAQNGAAIQELENTGPPLGLRMFKDITWEQGVARIAPGDALVLYTDGITEAQDAQEELFEEERLMGVVRANLGRSAQAIQHALVTGVHEFVGGAPQADDLTLMVLVRG
jgi:sigma-B regulation protein RsbU (phosphoserine phosphatase)